MPYRIEYSQRAEDHLADLGAHDSAMVFDAVPRQLMHQPTVATRNRKVLRPNDVAPWELRLGHLRVYYDVSEGPPPLVQIVAVGIKDRGRVLIGGQEVEL